MYFPIVVIFLLCKIEFSEGLIYGQDAKPGQFPFIVSLRNETNKHYCAGSIVTKQHILTAAHCLFTDRSVFHYDVEEMYEPRVIKAVVGTVSINDFDGVFYQASELLPHPQYKVTNAYSIFFDVGIIQLSREIASKNIIPILLPIAPVIFEASAIVAGWGVYRREDIKERNQMSQVLKIADTLVMRPEKCINKYLDDIPELAFVTEAIFVGSAFCCIDENVNVCYRDSGGPLIQNGRLAGIVISGNECKKGSPDIFTSVHQYLDFIFDCIEDRCTASMICKEFFMRLSL